MEAVAKYPHEARVQRFAYAALALAAALAAFDAFSTPGRIFGLDVPLLARLALVVAAAGAGAFAVSRRATALSLVAGALLVASVVPGASLDPGLLGYVRGFALGGFILAFHELVSQTARYDRAHKLVEEDGASEASLDRVTDEALKTLLVRLGLALGVAFGAVVLALVLANAGPARLREGIETASPLGVAVLGVFAILALSLFILARGASFRRRPSEPSEVAADVPE